MRQPRACLEELWIEVGLRLGVEGPGGIRAAAGPTAGTGARATRLRRFAELWQGQPEAERMRQALCALLAVAAARLRRTTR